MTNPFSLREKARMKGVMVTRRYMVLGQLIQVRKPGRKCVFLVVYLFQNALGCVTWTEKNNKEI
jgi:hypothetical protein